MWKARVALLLATAAGIAALARNSIVSAQLVQQLSPNALLSGQTGPALAHSQSGWCSVARGNSIFQKSATANTASISFSQLFYFDGFQYYMLGGQSKLGFTSATSGNISFRSADLTGSMAVPFSNFSATVTGDQYLVHFSVIFPNKCTLPIQAAFDIS